MSETLHKGWLTTRDGEKYAPATLVENVYTRSGKPYDDRVREYIQSIQSGNETSLTPIRSTLEQYLKEIKKLQAKDESIEEKLVNFNGDAHNDTLYIIDSQDRVIAYVDGTGVNSVDFTIPGLTSLSSVQNNINTINNSLTDIRGKIAAFDNIKDDGNDTLYIIDDQNRVIAYIDNLGMHSINFYVAEGQPDYLTTLQTIQENIDKIDGLQKSLNATSASLTNFIGDTNSRLKNFSGEDDNILFFIDNQDRVIAYIDAEGIHSTTILISEDIKYVKSSLSIKNHSGNEVAYVDDDGVHSTNFLIHNSSGTLVRNLVDVITQLEKIDSELSANLTTEQNNRLQGDAKLQSSIDILNDKTKNLDSADSNTFFIIDGSNQVVAYIDATGINAINVTAKKKNANGQLETIGDLISHASSIANLQNRMTPVESGIENLQNRVNIQEQVTGETTTPASGKDHKSRLNNLDNLVGTSNDSANWDGTTHEAQINALKNAVGNPNHGANAATGHELRLDNLEANLTSEITNRTSADSALSERIDTNKDLIDNVNKYFGNFDSDALYILDKDSKVVALIDSNGLTTTNITLKTSQSSTLNNVQNKSTMTFFSAVGTVTFSDDILL